MVKIALPALSWTAFVRVLTPSKPTYRSLVIAVLLFALGTGHAMARPTATEAAPVSSEAAIVGPSIAATRDILGESRLYCLALAVYFEGGSTTESEEGQRHIARVVTERAKANRKKWGGADICDVVFYQRAGVCQFSFACLPTVQRTPKGGPAWRYSLEIAQEELEDKSSVQEHSIRYYLNPAITSDRNVCRFRKEFIPMLQAGRHEFFREPTAAERTELATSEPPECKRYAEAQGARKHAPARAKKAQKTLAKVTSKHHETAATHKNKSKSKRQRHAHK